MYYIIQLFVNNSLAVSKNNFIFHYVIGKGGFGKVLRIKILWPLRYGKSSRRRLRHPMRWRKCLSQSNRSQGHFKFFQSHYQEKRKFCHEWKSIAQYPEAPVHNDHLDDWLRFRFLVNMVYAFQDRENLYLVMDLMTGGDLRYHISRHRRFTEEQTSNF